MPLPQRERESACLGTVVVKTAKKVIKPFWQVGVTVKNMIKLENNNKLNVKAM